MNIRAIFNHSMSVIFSITTYMFIYKLITINYTHIHTGSFETDLVYWVSVINSIFLMIMIVTSMVFIYYYATDKGYIVNSTYELYLYENAIFYLEMFIITYPITLWIVMLVYLISNI